MRHLPTLLFIERRIDDDVPRTPDSLHSREEGNEPPRPTWALDRMGVGPGRWHAKAFHLVFLPTDEPRTPPTDLQAGPARPGLVRYEQLRVVRRRNRRHEAQIEEAAPFRGGHDGIGPHRPRVAPIQRTPRA